MDLTLKTPAGRFNYRAAAVILHDNQILAMQDEGHPYYYLPGGRVQLHETAENAVLREVREELLIDAQIIRPLWFNQAFFEESVSKEKFHELCLYFLIDVAQTDLLHRGPQFTLTDHEATHHFQWLPIDRLHEYSLVPKFIQTAIHHLPATLELRHEYD